jgi:hypothetical protein
MLSVNFPEVFVVHYTKLVSRKLFLEKTLAESQVKPIWVTESSYYQFKSIEPSGNRIIGVNEKLAGMDLGVNSRSRSRSRRKARIEGRILFLRSYLFRNKILSTGSLPKKKKLQTAWIELQSMHMTAIQKGIETNKEWILVLEDDAIPTTGAFLKIAEIQKNIEPKNLWINLNSGAGLKRTASENKVDKHGLFEVKPAATRCAVAYLISKDLAIKFLNSALEEGIPNWLPIDFYFQVLLRKYKAKSFWIDPVLFDQGSESGEFKSGFEKFR